MRLVAVLLLVACSRTDVSFCQTDAACPGGYQCAAGTCQPLGGRPTGDNDAPPTLAAQFVYAPIPSASVIEGFSLDEATGALTRVPGSPTPTPAPADGLKADPHGRFVFATTDQADAIAGFAIDPSTGELEALPGSPYPVAGPPARIAIESTGQYLYAHRYVDPYSYFHSYSIAANGRLTELDPSPRQLWGGNMYAIDRHPNRPVIYATAYQAAYGYDVDLTTGDISPMPWNPNQAFGDNRNFAITSDGDVLLYPALWVIELRAHRRLDHRRTASSIRGGHSGVGALHLSDHSVGRPDLHRL